MEAVHKRLEAWKEAKKLAIEVYQLTKSFPKQETFLLASQMQRAAVSVPSNIAEGAARAGKVEFSRYLTVALGSLAELDTQLEISRELNYLSASSFEVSLKQIDKTRRLILGLRKSLNQK